MKEFEVSAKDPNRLFGPSFRLMEEEKFRRSAYPNLVRLEAEICEGLLAFKDRFGEDMRWEGRGLRQAIEEEKENRYVNESVFFFVSPGGASGDLKSSKPTSNKRKA